MNIKLLRNIKKYILEMKGIYTYDNNNELEKIVDKIVQFIESTQYTSRLFLEVKEKTLYLGEYLRNEIKIHKKTPLLDEMAFKKIYDMLNEKLSLKIGVHHNFGQSRFQYNIFISKISIDLISDNQFDKIWLKEYYQKDNYQNVKQTKVLSKQNK